LYLVGPSGIVVTLNVNDPFTGYYEGEDYIATTFDDEAETEIADGRPPFDGSFRPLEALAALDGLDACGPWRLRVYDAYYSDTGCLDFFALLITVSSPEPPVAVPIPSAGGLALLGVAVIGHAAARSDRHR
jgi:hypothetical protein